MTEDTIRKLEEQLDCPVCLGTYTDPKQLQCHHVFCRKCLTALVDRDQQGKLILPCPTCRQTTPLPTGGVAGLPPAFHINRIRSIVLEHKGGMTVGVACCSEHGGRKRELFCETCQELICCKCALKGGTHHSHEYVERGKALERRRVEIASSMEPVQERLARAKRAELGLEARRGEIWDQQAAIEASIDSTARRLHDIVRRRRFELVDQLRQITESKLRELAGQLSRVKTCQAECGDCLDSLREPLEAGDDGQVLTAGMAALEKAKKLSSNFQADSLEPATEVDITFSAQSDVWTECKSYGKVYMSGVPCSSLCHVMGAGLEAAMVVGEEVSFTVCVLNANGEPCKKLVDSITCALVSEITGTSVEGAVEAERRGHGLSQYGISLRPSVKGRHQLQVRVGGEHVKGSPFSMMATLSVEKLGDPFLTMEGVMSPGGVAVSPNGKVVVVTEKLKHCVSVFSLRGEKLCSFGCHGSGPGQFDCPCGVAVDSEGNIIVVDFNNHRVQKFSDRGRFLTAISFNDPEPQVVTDVAFNIRNDKVYLVGRGHSVHVLNSDLTLFDSFARGDEGHAHFSSSAGITCDVSGNVYVADSADAQVRVFSPEGEFCRAFERHEEGRGELGYPYPLGLAVDDKGLVYANDYHGHRVSVYNPEGGFVTSFGGSGRGQDAGGLCGVAVGGSGVVYVCDETNSCVQLF